MVIDGRLRLKNSNPFRLNFILIIFITYSILKLACDSTEFHVPRFRGEINLTSNYPKCFLITNREKRIHLNTMHVQKMKCFNDGPTPPPPPHHALTILVPTKTYDQSLNNFSFMKIGLKKVSFLLVIFLTHPTLITNYLRS